MGANANADVTTKRGTARGFSNVGEQNEVFELMAKTAYLHEKVLGTLLFGCCLFHGIILVLSILYIQIIFYVF
jgi:hypothetical protein